MVTYKKSTKAAFRIKEETKMEIIREDGKIKVACSYSTQFIKKAHELGGKWAKPYWVFDDKVRDALDKALLKIYGEGLSPTERVEIEIDLDNYNNGDYDNLVFRGLTLVSRPARDASVRLASQVYVKEGGFKNRGGSAKYPMVTWEDGTVIVASVPVTLASELPAGVKLVDENDVKSRLLDEKEQLLKRLAEIEKTLETL